MAFRSFAVSIAHDVPTLLFQAQPGDVEVWVDVDESTLTFYVGGDDVTTSNGLRLTGSSTPAFHSHIRPGDELYVTTATVAGLSANVLIRSA